MMQGEQQHWDAAEQSGNRPPGMEQGGGQQGVVVDQQQQQFLGFGINQNWGGGFGGMMPQGYHLGGIDGSQLMPGLSSSMDPLEALLGSFPCARVRGIPYEATPEDVLVFFQGLVVIDVVLVSPHAIEGGEMLGEAYVVFANPMDFQMGLQRDHQIMGNRYLEIFQGKRSDYYAAIASQHHHMLDPSVALAGQGGDAIGVGGGTLVPGGIALGLGDSNGAIERKGGGDMAQSAASDVGAAWNRKPGGGPNSTATKNTNQTGGGGGPGVSSGGNVGGGGVPSYHNNGGYGGRGANNPGGGGRGGYRGNNYRAEGHQGTGGGTRDGPHTGYIRLRGLPFNATTQDILNFFKEYKPLETSAILTYRADGRATGEGYVAFDDVEDAKGAMSLHRRTIGSRYVELFISNKEEYKRNVTRSTTAQS